MTGQVHCILSPSLGAGERQPVVCTPLTGSFSRHLCVSGMLHVIHFCHPRAVQRGVVVRNCCLSRKGFMKISSI